MTTSAHEELLLELLNAIHGDGGSRTIKLGLQKSVQDAIEKWRLVHGHSEALSIARNDLAANKIRITELEQDLDEVHATLSRTGDILRNTANAIHGGPLKNGFWSHHDLPELVKILRDHCDPEVVKTIETSEVAWKKFRK